MTFDNAIELMKNQNLLHVKVVDVKGNRVVEFCDEQSVENTINQLNKYKDMLSSYGAITIHAANDSIKKQNWKDSFKWYVTFNGSTVNAPVQQTNSIGAIPTGYVSHEQAMLMAQLQGLTQKMEMQAELQKMRDEFGTKKEDSFEKYLPMAALFMDIPADKIQLMMAMKSMSSPQQSQGIAGIQSTTVEFKGTPEEEVKVVEIENNIEKVIEAIGHDKVLLLTTALKNNPAFADMALNFLPK